MNKKLTAILLLLGMLALTVYTFNVLAGIDHDPFAIELGDD